MKLKKIIAAIAAGAMALSMSVVNAFASTVTMNSEYAGAWALTAYIPKSELTAIGGDVKVTLHITPKAPLIGTINSVLAPTDANWTRLTQDPTDTSKITSDTAVAKEDGMLVVNGTLAEDTVSFVISADAINALTDDGLTFQANDLIVTSADLEAGTPEGALRIVNEEQSGLMIQEGKTYEEVTAPADEAAPEETAEEADEATADAADAAVEAPADEEAGGSDADAAADDSAELVEEAPAADTTTDAAATGNVAVASIVAVMAIAGAAAVATKKRK